MSETTPKVVRTIRALRAAVDAWRSAGERVALVPTMGALHAGHLALVKLARRRADRVVVSIFVNPAQFAPHEDFSKYPRTFRSDLRKLAGLSTELVYNPAPAVMYPPGFVTRIVPQGPATVGLEDRFRPHFFGGVATVVAKLFTQCGPDVAVFGEKDFQQLRVVEQMVRDLDLPMTIIGAPTVREADGLAMSSRNVFLSADERARAVVLPTVLRECAAALAAGRPRAAALTRGVKQLTAAGFKVDYLEARDAATLALPGRGHRGPLRLLAAARMGTTRLIDNIAVPSS